MIKAIMAIDEKGGISKGQSMPWPKNSIDLKWFKENTIEQWKSKNNFKRTKLDIFIEKNTNNKYVGYLAKKNRKGELEFRIKSGQCNSKDATLKSLQKKLH